MSDQPATLPAPPPAGYGRWFTLAFFLVLMGVPVLLSDDPYRLEQFTKYLALALFALSVDLIWGYTGLLSLGQGLYFGIGAYAIGFSLILEKAAASGDPRPDYMRQCRMEEVPGWIAPLSNIYLAWGVALLLPILVAGIFGGLVFYRRIKGVYFSLITQALLLAVFELVRNQRPYTGGVDGLTSLARMTLFGYEFKSYVSLFYLVLAVLTVSFVGCTLLMRSKFGKLLTAIRDNEYRVLALGYNTAMYKTFIFVLSAVLASVAGGLFVAANNSAGPQFLDIPTSIEVIIFVAVGGRGTLIGAILGALLVNFTKTYANEYLTKVWPIILGAMFIGITVFLPDGILGGLKRLMARWKQRPFTVPGPEVPDTAPRVAADGPAIPTDLRSPMADNVKTQDRNVRS